MGALVVELDALYSLEEILDEAVIGVATRHLEGGINGVVGARGGRDKLADGTSPQNLIGLRAQLSHVGILRPVCNSLVMTCTARTVLYVLRAAQGRGHW